MRGTGSARYRLARFTGRFVTRTAALLTAGHMPPFVSASMIVVVRARILTVFDPIRGEAVLPGGHLRWTEQPAAGAAREVREETGYTVVSGTLVGVYAGAELTGELGIVRVVYTGEIVGGSIQSSAEGRAAWLPVVDYIASSARDASIVRGWSERTVPTRTD